MHLVCKWHTRNADVYDKQYRVYKNTSVSLSSHRWHWGPTSCFPQSSTSPVAHILHFTTKRRNKSNSLFLWIFYSLIYGTRCLLNISYGKIGYFLSFCSLGLMPWVDKVKQWVELNRKSCRCLSVHLSFYRCTKAFSTLNTLRRNFILEIPMACKINFLFAKSILTKNKK